MGGADHTSRAGDRAQSTALVTVCLTLDPVHNPFPPGASHARYCAPAYQRIDQERCHHEATVAASAHRTLKWNVDSNIGTAELSLDLSNLHLQEWDNMPTLKAHYAHSFQAVLGFLFIASPAWRLPDRVSYLCILWHTNASQKGSPLLLSLAS